jgi:hypothetical protein
MLARMQREPRVAELIDLLDASAKRIADLVTNLMDHAQ